MTTAQKRFMSAEDLAVQHPTLRHDDMSAAEQYYKMLENARHHLAGILNKRYSDIKAQGQNLRQVRRQICWSCHRTILPVVDPILREYGETIGNIAIGHGDYEDMPAFWVGMPGGDPFFTVVVFRWPLKASTPHLEVITNAEFVSQAIYLAVALMEAGIPYKVQYIHQ
jgi:hypothetical protein